MPGLSSGWVSLLFCWIRVLSEIGNLFYRDSNAVVPSLRTRFDCIDLSLNVVCVCFFFFSLSFGWLLLSASGLPRFKHDNLPEETGFGQGKKYYVNIRYNPFSFEYCGMFSCYIFCFYCALEMVSVFQLLFISTRVSSGSSSATVEIWISSLLCSRGRISQASFSSVHLSNMLCLRKDCSW